MAKVLCTLKNASTNINGIKFVTHRDGMISEEIDDEVAKQLATINGYEIHDPGQTDKVASAVLEAARRKAADEQAAAEKAKQGGTIPQNSQPPAPPAGSSSSPPAGGTAQQQSAPAGGTPPATSPAGSKDTEGTGKEGTPDPNF